MCIVLQLLCMAGEHRCGITAQHLFPVIHTLLPAERFMREKLQPMHMRSSSLAFFSDSSHSNRESYTQQDKPDASSKWLAWELATWAWRDPTTWLPCSENQDLQQLQSSVKQSWNSDHVTS